MKKFFSSLLLSAAIITSPAQAKGAIWFRGPLWEVTGYTEGYCLAQASYSDRLTLGLAISKQAKFQVVLTSPYTVGRGYVTTFTTGSMSATVVGRSLGGNTIIYDFQHEAMTTLAYAQNLYISTLDTSYEMTGSMQALTELMACWQAMNGKSA